MISSDKVLEYAKEQVNGGSPYAFAFGMAWASLSKTAQKELTKYAERQLANIKAERGEN
jgi:hypothetical protein